MNTCLRLLTAAALLLSLCLALVSCGEEKPDNESSAESIVSSEASSEETASHFVPVTSGEVSEGKGFVSTDPEKYPDGQQCD